MARPKGEISKLKLMQVHRLLPKDGSPISVKELKEKARKQKMGFDTLFKYLKKLVDSGMALKSADLDSRPPKICYERITEEELYGDKKFFVELSSFIEPFVSRARPIIKKVPLALRKKFYLESKLAILAAALALIEAQAKTIEREKRKEFIDIMMRIQVYPKLLKLSDKEEIEAKDWMNALMLPIQMVCKSLKSLIDEIKSHQPRLLAKLQPEFTKLAEDFTKELRKSEVIERR